MVIYAIEYSKKALQSIPNLKSAKLDGKVKELLEVLKKDPFQNPPPYEKLIGDLAGMYSRRINIKHRLVYSVNEAQKTVRILSMWTHYEY